MNVFTVKVRLWMGGHKVRQFVDPHKAWDFAFKNYMLTRILLAVDTANARVYGFRSREKFK